MRHGIIKPLLIIWQEADVLVMLKRIILVKSKNSVFPMLQALRRSMPVHTRILFLAWRAWTPSSGLSRPKRASLPCPYG